MSGSTTNPTVSPADPDSLGPSVVEFLRQPNAYPDNTSSVELIETHISWVFLTDHFVYKLKKPVRFEFLDFSGVEQRQAACASELKLNRRLSPDVYIDVVPVTLNARECLQLGGAGRAIDWVVKMKRLPADSSLDQLIQHQRLTKKDVDTLATTLARFYGRLPPLTMRAAEYLRGIEHHVRANSDELAKPEYGFDPWLLRRLHAAQMRFIAVAHETLVNRVRDGRIVDGHGDLRPEHIYFTSTPKMIDCLEFSEELRTIDVADELAFLAMECDRLGAEWVGQQIVSTYCATNGDRVASELIEFFKCYRACVRAKVNSLRSRQVPKPDAAKLITVSGAYLRLADRSAERLGPPILLVVRGLSGTGKSTLAAALSESLGCGCLQSDKLRRQLFGAPTSDANFNTGRYSAENRQVVYDNLFRLAEEQLSHGLSVILDGTFLTSESRRRAIQLASIHQAVPVLVTCTCPSSLAIERIRDRGTVRTTESDVRPEFVDRQRSEEEPDDPAWQVVTVDTTEGLAVIRQTVLGRIRSLVLPGEC